MQIEDPITRSLTAAVQNSKLSIVRANANPNDLTYAYFHDLSSRARVKLNLRIDFSCSEDWSAVQRANIMINEGDKDMIGSDNAYLKFECDCEHSSDGEGDGAMVANKTTLNDISMNVDGIRILSSELAKNNEGEEEMALLFNVEVILSASKLHNGYKKEKDPQREVSVQKRNGNWKNSIFVTLSIQAAFSIREATKGNEHYNALSSPRSNIAGLVKPSMIGDISLAQLAIEMGASSMNPPLFDAAKKNSTVVQHYQTKIIRTKKQKLPLNLVDALTVTVNEIGGSRAAAGATLVSLTIAHSNLHDQPVTLTNIALHPGHSILCSTDSSEGNPNNKSSSRQSATNPGNQYVSHASQLSYEYHPFLPKPSVNRSIPGAHDSVVDMSLNTRWSYSPGTALDLPLTLNPYEAIATVIQIDASEIMKSRSFYAPISVISRVNNDDRLLLSTNVRYTTSRIAVETSDALRIDMSLREARYRVGAPLVVSLRVLNLSNEDRDLMLLMAKDEDPSSSQKQQHMRAHSIHVKKKSTPLMQQPQQQQNQSVNTAVVSEVNGYTFGVWGLAGNDDGTTRHNRDHELLAVDAALLLGEVKGQHSIEAELRFVPLREGTLDCPNLKIYDKLQNKWYNCKHMLKIVASA